MSLFRKPKKCRRISHFDGILGTSLDLQLVSSTANDLALWEQEILNEIDRLDLIFSRYRVDSEFSQWQATEGEWINASPELYEILKKAEYWRSRTKNAFHPAAEAVAKGSGFRWELRDGRALNATELSGSLDAIAKGYIIDRCAQRAIESGATEVVVNIGGDIRHMGSQSLEVSIADPSNDAENAAPFDRIKIRNQGLATSGNYRRHAIWNGETGSHIFDARTGGTAEQVKSATVIAPDAMTADVLSTAFSVMLPEESLAFAESVDHIAFLLVTASGVRIESPSWYSFRV